MKRILYILTIIIGISPVVQSQCLTDRHNTTWYDGWISCDASLNPNQERGLSHWIMYDFAKETEIKGLHIWNSNIPGYLDYGMKSVAIDYSKDGETWHEVGTYQFEQAPGKNSYEGFDLETFDSFKTRYLLLTALNNYGGECYGLSEVRFDLDSSAYGFDENSDANACMSAMIYPNPFRSQTTLKVNIQCPSESYWFVTDSYGRQVVAKTEIPTPTQQNIVINASNWSAGVYYLTIMKDKIARQYKLVKLGGK